MKLTEVVNCFQFFNFKDHSQVYMAMHFPADSCELLSVL